MTNAEYLRKLRSDAAARGLCYVCRKRFPRPGVRTCDDCIERSRLAKAARVAAGRCTECRRRRALSNQKCRGCADKQNFRQAMKRRAQVAADRCQCIGCSHPPAPDRASCYEHLRRSSERARKVYAERVAAGRCCHGACAAPAAAGHVRCAKHLKSEAKRLAKYAAVRSQR